MHADPGQASRRDNDYLQQYALRAGQPYQPERKGVLVADTDDTAKLGYPGGEIDLQIVRATEGNDGVALGSLLAKTGLTTFDNGFVNTAACKSSITYIDGDAGILRYRGVSDRAARREVDVYRGQLPADLR